MVRLNKIVRALTFEGARGKRFTPEMALKRALMNCLLWEDQFYEDGVAIAERIKALVPQVAPARVAALAGLLFAVHPAHVEAVASTAAAACSSTLVRW